MWTALLAQLLPVFYMFFSPVVTEMVKGLAEKINATVPPNVVPIIGAVAGTIAGAITQAFDPSLSLNPQTGLISGLAGTGLHQAIFGHKYTATDTTPK
jgi:hypothetical protein